MTRINCIPVEELTREHLVAEYRELPRVFNLSRTNAKIPATYCMGAGHVTFFYDKLGYLFKRQHQLYDEMRARGYNANYHPDGLKDIGPRENWNDWEPDAAAMEINRSRIADRLKERK